MLYPEASVRVRFVKSDCSSAEFSNTVMTQQDDIESLLYLTAFLCLSRFGLQPDIIGYLYPIKC